MARRPRVVYSPEFRAEALRRVRETDQPIRHIARDLGISVGSLRGWMTAARPKAEVPLTEDERSELRRLRSENRELRLEREILKKATAFFAKHSE